MATLKDIAALAKVNVSTVSKALRGSSDINTETASHIRELAIQLGYELPPPISPANGEKYEKTIGVIFPELASQYYNSILYAFDRRMQEQGYRIVVSLTEFDCNQEMTAIKAFLRDGVSGIFLLTESTSHIHEIRRIFRKTQTPLMLVCTDNDIDFCDCIGINHTMGAAIAVNHLIKLGHRKIAYIGELHTEIRMNSFISTMKEHDLSLPDNYIVNLPERFEACGYKGMKRLLSEPDVPTAVFAAYDNIAYGAIRAIREANLRIPEDISVISIDANTTSEYLFPALTSINMPTQDIGELASVLLRKRLEGQHTASYQSVRLCPTLKLFESTCPPAEAEPVTAQ